jgi:hypothetical protein
MAERAAEMTSDVAPVCIDLQCSPALEQVSAIRSFLKNYCGPLLKDADLVDRMAIAIHELLENASKYSARGWARLCVAVNQSDGSDPELSIKVFNIPAAEHVEGLRSIVAKVMRAADPQEAYQDVMAASVQRSEGSGLGLARIRAEAGMKLSLTFQEEYACIEAVAVGTAKGPS